MGGSQSVMKSTTSLDGCTVDKFNYNWIVSDFENLLSKDVGYCECSDELKVDGEDTDTFKLVLYPNGFNERVKGYVSLWLQKTSSKERLITFTCILVDSKGRYVLKKSIKQTLNVESFLGWMTFCPRNIILEEDFIVLLDNKLTLKCTVSIFRDSALMNPEIEYDLSLNLMSIDLSNNLRHLFLEKDFQDFRIEVQGKTFHVHKAILSARSPVFKVMLKSPLPCKGKMTITDIAVPTVTEMLNFMYTDTVGYLDFQEASALYYAADKYELCSLKNICCKIIKKNLEPENVLSALLLSERHCDVELKEVCIQFVVRNAPKVQQQDDWMVLLKKQPHLANIVFKRLISKNVN